MNADKHRSLELKINPKIEPDLSYKQIWPQISVGRCRSRGATDSYAIVGGGGVDDERERKGIQV
jgi:hypothetical protein